MSNQRICLTLVVFLVALPWAVRLGARALTWRGDHDPQSTSLAHQHFTASEIARGRDYVRAYQPGGALASSLYWLTMGIVVFRQFGRKLAERLPGRGWVWQALAIGVAAYLLVRLILLPTTYYHGFVLEGAFGFRRLDAGGWWWRLCKGWGVNLATQLGLAIGLLWLMRRWPRRWVAWAAGLGALVSYFFIIAWPHLILPLFYRVTPLPEGSLHDSVVALAEDAGVGVTQIQMIDQSRVSAHTNAFFVGIGNRRSIYLYDTLAEQHTHAEVLAVVAHEIGHWRKRHMLKGWLLGVAGAALGLALLKRLLDQPRVLHLLGARRAGDPALTPFLWLAIAAAQLYVSPIESAISRRFESQADQTALELTGAPATFIAMKVNGARNNRRDLLPHPWVHRWYGSHPTVLERITRAEAWAADR